MGGDSYRFFDIEHEFENRICVSHKGFKIFETENLKNRFLGIFQIFIIGEECFQDFSKYTNEILYVP